MTVIRNNAFTYYNITKANKAAGQKTLGAKSVILLYFNKFNNACMQTIY